MPRRAPCRMIGDLFSADRNLGKREAPLEGYFDSASCCAPPQRPPFLAYRPSHRSYARLHSFSMRSSTPTAVEIFADCAKIPANGEGHILGDGYFYPLIFVDWLFIGSVSGLEDWLRVSRRYRNTYAAIAHDSRSRSRSRGCSRIQIVLEDEATCSAIYEPLDSIKCFGMHLLYRRG